MSTQKLGRRELLARSAGVAALVGTAAIPIAVKAEPHGAMADSSATTIAGDAELRRLWAMYLDQLHRLRDADVAYQTARVPYEEDYDVRRAAGEDSGFELQRIWKNTASNRFAARQIGRAESLSR
jgi:hypothetical protein